MPGGKTHGGSKSPRMGPTMLFDFKVEVSAVQARPIELGD